MTAKKEDEEKEDLKEAQRACARRGWEEAIAFLRRCREHERRSENVKMIPIT